MAEAKHKETLQDQLGWLCLIVMACVATFLITKDYYKTVVAPKVESATVSSPQQLPTAEQILGNQHTRLTRVSDTVLIAQVAPLSGSRIEPSRTFILVHNMARDGSLEDTSVKEIRNDTQNPQE